MDEILIQQEIKWEENSRIWGRMLLNIDDEQLRQETEEKGFGYIVFSYDVKTSSFTLEETNAPETVKRYGKEIITELWGKVKSVRTYWESTEYRRYKNAVSRLNKSETAE